MKLLFTINFPKICSMIFDRKSFTFSQFSKRSNISLPIWRLNSLAENEMIENLQDTVDVIDGARWGVKHRLDPPVIGPHSVCRKHFYGQSILLVHIHSDQKPGKYITERSNQNYTISQSTKSIFPLFTIV